MMAAFRVINDVWCAGVHLNIALLQVNRVFGLAILAKFLMNFL